MTDTNRVITPRIENFIGIYDDAFSKEFCEHTIQHFETQKENGFFVDRLTECPKWMKDDNSVFPNATQESISVYGRECIIELNSTLKQCYADYRKHFAILDEPNTHPHGNSELKIQKTQVSGGYHIWHYESCTPDCAKRLLAWMVYLNDVEEGGETEFLYLAKRIKPKQGTLVIWPAGFTHTHRGNPPLTNDKYIATGWLEF